MKPYGIRGNSPPHIKRGGAPNGYFATFVSLCGCCDGKYVKKHKSMKAFARRQNKVNKFCDEDM